jgi:hypothetical protein
MLKRDITYEDFNGDTVTDTVYFNLSKPELMELQVEHKEGFAGMIQQIVKAEDTKALIKEFKSLILMSYGVKSPDGKRFTKSDELREDFSHTGAFQALFMELATDDKVAMQFVQGVLPRDMVVDFQKAVEAPEVTPTPAA